MVVDLAVEYDHQLFTHVPHRLRTFRSGVDDREPATAEPYAVIRRNPVAARVRAARHHPVRDGLELRPANLRGAIREQGGDATHRGEILGGGMENSTRNAR